MTETLYWAIGIAILAGLAYFVMSRSSFTPKARETTGGCSKCPRASGQMGQMN